jgi:hypothetical protein
VQRLTKHVPVPREQILNNATVGLQQWKKGVSTWSVPRSYLEDNWGGLGQLRVVSSVGFCTGGCEERTLALEAEETPLLETVVRERLMKTQQAGKGLAGAVVICELWTLAFGL